MKKPSYQRGRAGVTRHGITLTERQMQVLEMADAGMGTSELAQRLGIGKDQVKEIKSKIKLNLGFDIGANTEEMIARARKLGFLN